MNSTLVKSLGDIETSLPNIIAPTVVVSAPQISVRNRKKLSDLVTEIMWNGSSPQCDSSAQIHMHAQCKTMHTTVVNYFDMIKLNILKLAKNSIKHSYRARSSGLPSRCTFVCFFQNLRLNTQKIIK